MTEPIPTIDKPIAVAIPTIDKRLKVLRDAKIFDMRRRPRIIIEITLTKNAGINTKQNRSRGDIALCNAYFLL